MGERRTDTEERTDTGQRAEAEQRTEEATAIADEELREQDQAVVHGPEGQAGAAGAGAPNGGVTGGDPELRS